MGYDPPLTSHENPIILYIPERLPCMKNKPSPKSTSLSQKGISMVTTNIRGIIQDLILPEFRTLQVEIHRLDEKIDSFREEFRTEIRRLDQRIDSLKESLEKQIDSFREEFRTEINRLDQRIDSLEKQMQVTREDFKLAIDLHERIASLEAKLSSH